MYLQARQKLGLGIGESAVPSLLTSQALGSSSFQLDKDVELPPGWTLEEVNLVLLLRERDPPVTYKQIQSQYLPSKLLSSLDKVRTKVLKAHGT